MRGPYKKNPKRDLNLENYPCTDHAAKVVSREGQRTVNYRDIQKKGLKITCRYIAQTNQHIYRFVCFYTSILKLLTYLPNYLPTYLLIYLPVGSCRDISVSGGFIGTRVRVCEHGEVPAKMIKRVGTLNPKPLNPKPLNPKTLNP